MFSARNSRIVFVWQRIHILLIRDYRVLGE